MRIVGAEHRVSKTVKVEKATRYYKSGNYKKLEEILPEMDMVMINDVFRKSVEFAIRKTPTQIGRAHV